MSADRPRVSNRVKLCSWRNAPLREQQDAGALCARTVLSRSLSTCYRHEADRTGSGRMLGERVGAAQARPRGTRAANRMRRPVNPARTIQVFGRSCGLIRRPDDFLPQGHAHVRGFVALRDQGISATRSLKRSFITGCLPFLVSTMTTNSRKVAVSLKCTVSWVWPP